jgi:hypothetical protein
MCGDMIPKTIGLDEPEPEKNQQKIQLNSLERHCYEDFQSLCVPGTMCLYWSPCERIQAITLSAFRCTLHGFAISGRERRWNSRPSVSSWNVNSKMIAK